MSGLSMLSWLTPVGGIFKSIKLYIYVAIATLFIVLVGSFYWYYKSSQATIATLTANNAKLEIAIQTNEKTIKSLQNDINLLNKTYADLFKKFNAADQDNQRLRDKLSEHDLGYLAEKKPGLVESIINKATQDANRCFEIMSGSTLTDSEKKATKPSEINTQCPSIANPNYKGN